MNRMGLETELGGSVLVYEREDVRSLGEMEQVERFWEVAVTCCLGVIPGYLVMAP